MEDSDVVESEENEENKKNEENVENEGNDENEKIRELILQQLANLEPSEVSDDDSYKVRLSCILEDDENESNTHVQKNAQKEIDDTPLEDCSSGAPVGVNTDEELASDSVQITDLDNDSQISVTDTEAFGAEKMNEGPLEEGDEPEKSEGFALKKLKSSDDVVKRQFVTRRTEHSSDSSDFDISVTNSADGVVGDKKILEISEADDKNVSDVATDVPGIESETSADEEFVQKPKNNGEVEVLDNETLSSIFAKVSKTYLEKTKSHVKWEETEKIDSAIVGMEEERAKSKESQRVGDHLSLQDAHIRGASGKSYVPPIPPETYLWEELKRLRERGGYPWTYLDKPPFDEATWKKYMDHVYEPINPPTSASDFSSELPTAHSTSRVSSIPQNETQFIEISNKDSAAEEEPGHVARDSNIENVTSAEEPEAGEVDPTPEASVIAGSSTESKTQSSAPGSKLLAAKLGNLPALHGVLGKTRREQIRAHAQDVQHKLRNQAGLIKTKFSHIQRPPLTTKNDADGGKGTFRVPDMSAFKIGFPNHEKFKFQLPESSKFHLPVKSKFHIPKRPKFNFTKKIHLPERGKFTLMDKSVFHMPDTSKIHMPDMAKFHLPDGSRFHLPKKPKFHLAEKVKFNRAKLEIPKLGRSKSLQELATSSKSRFDIKAYPRLFAKHPRDYVTSSPKQTRGRSRINKEQIGAPQEITYDKETGDLADLQYAGEEVENIRETDSQNGESLFDYRQKESDELENLEGESRRREKPPCPPQKYFEYEIPDVRKKGVLEEINSDEYFLRQKGISQDNIEMGNYLSREIREAFRSPHANALAKMDYVDDENIHMKNQRQPSRPSRSSSVKKKSILKKAFKSDPSLSDDNYKTYPPRKPARKSRSRSKSLLNEDVLIAATNAESEMSDLNRSSHDNGDDVNLSRYDNIDDISEYYKTPGPAKEYEHYQVPRSHVPLSSSTVTTSKSSLEDVASSQTVYDAWLHGSKVTPEPVSPRTRQRLKKKEEPERLELASKEVIDETQDFSRAQAMDSPTPPKRTRARSLGSKSLKSLSANDEMSRSFRSGPRGRSATEIEDIASIEESTPARSTSELAAPTGEGNEEFDLDDACFGYATVGKPALVKPQRRKTRGKKLEVPTPPFRRRETSFSSRRADGTLRPSRPPRFKTSSRSLTPAEGVYSEIQGKTKKRPLGLSEGFGSTHLQTEEVIEKMKGRPLPPPPRPPRQKSKGPDDEAELTEAELISLSILKSHEFPIEKKVTALVHSPPPENEIEEVCVSTQTDPLPDNFSFEGEDDNELTREFGDEQLKIQQAFLEEMRREEEMRPNEGMSDGGSLSAELKADVIRQIEDIIAEERRLLKEQKREQNSHIVKARPNLDGDEQKAGQHNLDADADMGYASLERKVHRQDPIQIPLEHQPQILQKLEKLQVKEIEAETINVHEVQANQIFVKELQSNRVASQDIDNTGGNVALGSISFPSNFIDQIVTKIPWEALRESREQFQNPEGSSSSPPIRPRRQRESQFQHDSDDENVLPKKTYRRYHKPVFPAEECGGQCAQDSLKGKGSSESIPDLSLQLASACTTAGLRTLRALGQTGARVIGSLDKEVWVQLVLCMAVALVAAYFIFGFDAKIIHVNRWDFQFPPKPANTGD